jgi:flavin-dependent dehydrogenase
MLGSDSMAEQFDIVIMGGGPAGAVTALCLSRNGWRVALFERGSFDQVRIGETLPPEINPVLRNLGLWEPFLLQSPLESPGTISVWGSSAPTEVDFTGNAFGCGWHVDRRRFDAMLCREAAKSGTSLFLGRAVRWAREAEMWRVGDVCAKILVDATGRNGLPLDGRSDRSWDDVLLAVVLPISIQPGRLLDLRTCIETAPAGWWYSTLLPSGDALAVFFTGAEVYRESGVSLSKQLPAAPRTRRRLDEGTVGEPRIVLAPSGRRGKLFGKDWVAVGDSASCYDPLSGRGIFKALRQGQAAARAIDKRLRGDLTETDKYAELVEREFDQYARQRTIYYSLEHRWADQLFWRRRRNP